MAEAEFRVTYDGPALADGRMPVRDLAPSLLALGELVGEASRIAYPDQEAPALNIRATTEGSFVVHLWLHSPDSWGQFVQLLSGKPVTALTNLQTIIFGTGGLLWLIMQLRGRTVTSQQPVASGHIRLTLDDGTTLDVPAETVQLYRRLPARRNARKVVEPLSRKGVERVDFVAEEGAALVLATELLDQLYEIHVHGACPMPRRKKTAPELKDRELFKKMFPKKVREEAEKTALESQKKSTRDQSK